MQKVEMPWLFDTPVVPTLLVEIKRVMDEGQCKVEWRDGTKCKLNEKN